MAELHEEEDWMEEMSGWMAKDGYAWDDVNMKPLDLKDVMAGRWE